MNIVERRVYNFVKKNPKIKTLIRDIYQTLLYLLPGKNEKAQFHINIREGYYFGFHDKSPWSFDNKFLLANKYNIPLREPKKDDTLEIGYFAGNDFKNFKRLALTKSFNWQQGCMLQWIGETNNILYNDFKGNKNFAKIIDTDGSLIKELPSAIGALSTDGNLALSYSFERLAKYAKGYGYKNGIDEELNVQMPLFHGLSIININSGTSKQLFSIKDIASFKAEKDNDKSFHYFTHCLFSPSNNRFVFFHRWIKAMNFVYTRMISCDTEGKDLHIFPSHQMISHIGWKDENHILAYCRIKNIGDRYVIFEDKTDNFKIIGENIFERDGHPSFSPVNQRWIITDTYPDSKRFSSLILYDIQKNIKYDLAKLKQPLKYKEELRCDLHPRWDRTGKIVCFDSAHTGKRSLCTMDIREIIENNS
jgi:hypothetical protein